MLSLTERNQNNANVQALFKALTSEEIKTFINNTYSGAVVPIF